MNTKKLIVPLFLFIVLVGMLLRFYHIEQIIPFGWDQTRDAYQAVFLLKGKLPLEGPKTGVGNFHLGPLYFYLLAPFFFFTRFDPIASQYLNMTINLLAFGIVFYVTRKLFSTRLAFLALGMYTVSTYVINSNRVPWNVSLVPTLSFLIFYFTYKTFKEKRYKWSAILMALCGLFFHAHFTAVVFPIMICLLWLVSKEKLKLLKILLAAVPFYLIWYIPTIIDYFVTKHSQYFLLRDFFKYYFVGVHLQFFLHRLPDVLIQFRMILSVPALVGYFMLILLGVAYFFTSEKLYIKIIFAWLLSTLFIFGIYGGPISDYYFFFTIPVVFYCFLILVQMLFKLPKPVSITLLSGFLIYYGYINLKNYSNIGTYGLAVQKTYVKEQIRKKKKIPFTEENITYFLYQLYTNRL